MIKTNTVVPNELEQIIEQTDSHEGLVTVFTSMTNALLRKEREIFLRSQSEDKSNGFYSRQLSSAMGSLGIDVPRDRHNLFRSFFLPEPWKRSDPSFDNLLTQLVSQSYSPNKIKSLLTELGLPYSPEQINELKEELYTQAKAFKNRELPENVLALWIDAYHTEIKDETTSKVSKAVIYTILGMDMQGSKSIYGYFEFFGSESKEDWLQILNNLVSRGLKRCLLIISDDFPGLDSAISALFPTTDHQLCFVHLKRNVRKNMGKEDSHDFFQELDSLRKLKNFDMATQKFSALCQKLQKKYPSFIQYLLRKQSLYFSFLKYPAPIQKLIYTTNAVENFNSRLEVLRVNSGGYFQSLKTVDVAVFVLIQRLLKSRWNIKNNMVLSVQYELTQIFNQRFPNPQQTQFS